ncbi:MAG: hypothetical protein A2283_00470 [Lentisphaerae bacterium RIFOXYA12_FULL_48_11]|nr:MAG: hypothetical protein A2283_00470 [Lentisphaerae bacterium RIFOXYA12_FULL_48_11]
MIDGLEVLMFSANGHPPSAGDPGLEVRGMNTCFASIFATASPDKPLDSAEIHLLYIPLKYCFFIKLP